MVAPAEMPTIDDWEARFSKAKDITPEEAEEIQPPLLGLDEEED